MIGETELPTEILLQYHHNIEGDKGEILLPYNIGDTVIRYPSILHRAASSGGEEKVISEFTVFGGNLCCRFKGSNVPHWIDCVRPV